MELVLPATRWAVVTSRTAAGSAAIRLASRFNGSKSSAGEAAPVKVPRLASIPIASVCSLPRLESLPEKDMPGNAFSHDLFLGRGYCEVNESR
jgi:hypothetical protein